MNTETRLIKSRISLVLDYPFFGNLLLNLKLKEMPEIPTMATDGKDLVYNPEFVGILPDKDLKFVLSHEVMHVALCHFTRIDGREMHKWNVATDYAINGILFNSFGYIMDKCLYDPKYENMTAEQIYKLLPNEDGQNTKYKPSATGNVKIDGKTFKRFDEHKPCDIKQEQEWKIKISQAMAQAKEKGKLPGCMEIYMKEFLKPKIQWQTLLKNYVTSLAKNDYSYLKPNKRYMQQGLIMPSLNNESLGDVVVILDASGSVVEFQQRFASELNAIMQTIDCNIHLIVCDTEVRDYKVFTKNDILKLKYSGGGGTDLREAFKFMNKKSLNPSVVICLTDGETDFPKGCYAPTIWVLTEDNIIPFGNKVVIE